MDLFSIILIGIGLSLDCVAVAMAAGANVGRKNILILETALIAAFCFGVFQGSMLSIGWFGGSWLKGTVSDYDHWIAFGLLSLIGGKMIYEALFVKSDNDAKDAKLNLFDYRVMLALSFATSIDALVVGAGLAFINGSVFWVACIVGAVTFITSFVFVLLGRRFGKVFGNKIEIVGGIVLFGIGLKILFSHLGYIPLS